MNFQVLTMRKTDTKVKNQVLTNFLHCSVDREMVLWAQELAPSGIMLVLSQKNVSIYKWSKAFEFWHLKGSGQDLKVLLKKENNPPVTYLCSLFCKLTCTITVPKARRWPVLHDFVTIYIICVSMSVEQFYLQYPPILYTRNVCALGAEKQNG